MINPDSLSLMNEQEKLDLLRRFSEADSWRVSFELIYAELMNDDSPRVREEAIIALWDLADPKYIEPLMEKAAHDPDTGVRGKAASVLGIYIYEGVFADELSEAKFLMVRKLLLDLAQDPDEALEVRRMAIESLSFDSDPAVQELIDYAYHHASREMKMTAIFAMGRCGTSNWFDTIIEELDSDDPRFQGEAVNAACEAAVAGATPKLRNLAVSSDRELRLAAIWALSRTHGPGALETLEMCAESDDPEVRRVAGNAIEEFYSAENLDVEPNEDDDDEDEF